MLIRSKKAVYFKQNVQIEPLVNNWYAWVQLVAPGTSALNVTERYLKLMESFIANPQMHAIAVKDPMMRGGPFIDLAVSEVHRVEHLYVTTLERNKDAIGFSRAIKELRKILRTKATGYSMEPLYIDIPEELRGYVELFYDLENNSGFRLIEPLLYKSKYFVKENQSVALSFINSDGERPFLLSTPILEDDTKEHLHIPFCHEGLDVLFKMKSTPSSIDNIYQILENEIGDKRLFSSFFSEVPSPPYKRYTGDKMRIRYFGHACILIESKDISILLDPILSYTYESGISRYTYADLPDKIDYVLITHSHNDHILLETMLQLRHKVEHIIVGRNIDGALQDPSIKLMLENIGFKNKIIEFRELDQMQIQGGFILAIPFIGEHHDLFIHSKLAYYIRINDYSVLAIADSCNIDPFMYKHIHGMIGDIDVLFLGMECDGSPVSWAYGPLIGVEIKREMDHSRRGRGCNFNEGKHLVDIFNPDEVYVYAMGQEPWLRHILDLQFSDDSNPIVQSNLLIEHCRSKGIISERLFGEKEILSRKN